eukprot:gb/GFBE01003504.1/.p1 GENE.gb/GFBE01003504.1/~~gb/GFBE01003504.1/.p1  ORF type:complete len:154 (+),score=21.41 gb/GFBE01003504.1/:1-462(+)
MPATFNADDLSQIDVSLCRLSHVTQLDAEEGDACSTEAPTPTVLSRRATRSAAPEQQKGQESDSGESTHSSEALMSHATSSTQLPNYADYRHSPLRACFARRAVGMAPSCWFDSDEESEDEFGEESPDSIRQMAMTAPGVGLNSEAHPQEGPQ